MKKKEKSKIYKYINKIKIKKEKNQIILCYMN